MGLRTWRVEPAPLSAVCCVATRTFLIAEPYWIRYIKKGFHPGDQIVLLDLAGVG